MFSKTFLWLSLSLFGASIFAQETTELKGYTHISYKEFEKEAIKLIGDEWMLVAAGKLNSYNMMTANWGGLGWLWNKPVAFIFVRPQRFTYTFTEKEDYFTLTFFQEKHKDVLKIMGSKSGRDFDKMNYKGLTAIQTPSNSIAFNEAYIILECKKIFATRLQENDFVDVNIVDKSYPQKDFHTMYIGEIINIWIKK